MHWYFAEFTKLDKINKNMRIKYLNIIINWEILEFIDICYNNTWTIEYLFV